MVGIITDIQRFSLNDGPGIRTTVFFKGCNIACKWCHNPETINRRNQLMFYEEQCIGCGRCFRVCPQSVHRIEDGRHVIDLEKCAACGKCVEACYAEALRFPGKKVTLEEVGHKILQDKAYYDLSGGGVTLSGGEVFCQAEFADAIVDFCREKNIPVAAETNLHHNFAAIEPTLKKLDLVMCDLKIWDEDKHKEYTGVSSKLVKENIRKLDGLGIPVIVRTPLIPGATDDDANLLAIPEFVAGLKNVQYYELLNFNPLGGSKYKALHFPYEYAQAKPFSQERLEHIRELLKDYRIVRQDGVLAYFGRQGD